MRRNTRKFLTVGSLAVVLVAALAFAALAFANPSSELDGTHWSLTQLNGQPPVPGGGVPDLSFQADSRVGGNASCNSYGGVYAGDGSALSFNQVFSTKMACLEDALNAQESAYLQALETVAGYTLTGDTLTLTDAGGAAVLVYVRA